MRKNSVRNLVRKVFSTNSWFLSQTIIFPFSIKFINQGRFKSDVDTNQFQFTMYIPKISARANYESSGILILVQASGGGEYWGEYEGIKCKVYIRANRQNIGQRTFLTLQQIKMDFSVKKIRMGVENVHNGNSVIQAALNLFINTNAQELLKEMKPDLKKKLIGLMRNFVEHLFANIPYDAWIA